MLVGVGVVTATPWAENADRSGGTSSPRATQASVKLWMLAGTRCSSRSKIEKITSSLSQSRSAGSVLLERSRFGSSVRSQSAPATKSSSHAPGRGGPAGQAGLASVEADDVPSPAPVIFGFRGSVL